MARKLARSVHFTANGGRHSFAAGDEVPSELERFVTNRNAWEDSQAPADAVRVDVGGQRVVDPEQADHAAAMRAGFAQPERDERPAHNAAKAEWEEYARSQGVDPEGMTKAELVDRLG